MDRYSFLNAVHPAYIADLYDKYLQFPDSIEPSWRAFFQGFDFGIENGSLEALGIEGANGQISEEVLKEFQVIKLIDGYRTRGHLFT
jgi:2-oxoglutarate dehydrogenase E1 component